MEKHLGPDEPIRGKWPKKFPPLTREQQAISDDFMRHWHEVLPRKYGFVERFSHGFPVMTAPSRFRKTLEIGAGVGEHLSYEHLTDEQKEEYHAVELRENMAEEIRKRHPWAKVYVGDCQRTLPYPGGYFDRVIAVHVLEHLPDLPSAVREIRRVIDRDSGLFSVVIPCEGGLAYSIARRISAQRVFEKRYKMPYKWLIEREHVNRPHEIMEELHPHFRVVRSSYFPMLLPFTFCNLVIGMSLRPV